MVNTINLDFRKKKKKKANDLLLRPQISDLEEFEHNQEESVYFQTLKYQEVEKIIRLIYGGLLQR